MSDIKTIIQGIFNNHHAYYNSNGVETIKQQSSQQKQVEDAYQGRVIFELLQNGFDKADSKILVLLDETDEGIMLYVANDGIQFTYGANYDYRKGSNSRYDFQSLCSIATSSKTAVENIGNKGVGFKSVYSLSNSMDKDAGKYACVYTKARIIDDKDSQAVVVADCADIDFKIFDSFKSENDLEGISDIGPIREKMASVKRENASWGIPGYYYPILISERPQRVMELMKDGYVTVIGIPVHADDRETVESSIQSFYDKKYQFNFVRLKYDKEIAVEFKIARSGESPVQCGKALKVSNDSRLISKEISDDTYKIGVKAGVFTESEISKSGKPKVALYFRETQPVISGQESQWSPAQIYNYLPTEKPSLFVNVDIHADFHTSVDRKSIVLNNDTPIGEYNSALLKECYDLYLEAVRDTESLSNDLFSIEHLTLTDSEQDNDSTTVIINAFGNGDVVNTFKDIVTKRLLGSNCQSDDGLRYCYDILWNRFIIPLVKHSKYYNCSPKISPVQIGHGVKELGIKILPDVPAINGNTKIFYRENSGISIPEPIPCKLTSFSFWGNYSDLVKRNLGISDFNNTNELFVLFKQCEISDKSEVIYSREAISEAEQIGILATVTKLISERNESDNSAWRIQETIKYILSNSRDDYRLLPARAGHALSTLFYKTKLKDKDGNALYKPAQMLSKCDIDEDFLNSIMESANCGDEGILMLLKKTGVSLSDNCHYADRRIEDALKDGINYIPYPESSTKNKYEDYLDNIRVYWTNQDTQNCQHPILINENYPKLFAFLRRERSNTKEFRALGIGEYDNMPDVYVNKLKGHLKGITNTISPKDQHTLIKFYQKYFVNLYYRGIVLVKQGDKLAILNLDSSFIITSEELLLTNSATNLNILCYTGKGLEGERNYCNSSISLTEEDRVEHETEDNDMHQSIRSLIADEETIAKLLLKVSQSRLSERDYENDLLKRRKVYIFAKDLKLVWMDKIIGTCSIDGYDDIKIDDMAFFYDQSNSTIYIKSADGPEGNSLVARAISACFFGTESFADIVELVLFSDCWTAEEELDSMKNVEIDNLPEIVSSNEEDTAIIVAEPQTPVEIVWEDVPDATVSAASPRNAEDVEMISTAIKHRNVSDTSTPSNSQVNTGFDGETCVVKYIVKRFMELYRTEEERRQAIETINDFLQLPENQFSPIMFRDGQHFATFSDIADLLWYTKTYKYAHFDIVTLEEGDVVKLIEVKSTRGNDLFRLSKNESKVALQRAENYCLYRVNLDGDTPSIVNYGNPFSKQLMRRTDNLEIIPRGYDVICR